MKCPVDHAKIRPELAPMPDSMRHLPLDKRGYPVPFFVDHLNGEPEFRAMDPRKWKRCVTERLCWVCGGRFAGRFGFVQSAWFVIGPMCGVNRTTSEPPSHKECALWSVQNCPFLSRPHMVRREDDLTVSLKENVAGLPIDRNPGVTLLWPTDRYSIFDAGGGKPLIQIGQPTMPVQWWTQGRHATLSEVLASIHSGLPLLRDACERESTAERRAAAHDELSLYLRRLDPFLPKDSERTQVDAPR